MKKLLVPLAAGAFLCVCAPVMAGDATAPASPQAPAIAPTVMSDTEMDRVVAGGVTYDDLRLPDGTVLTGQVADGTDLNDLRTEQAFAVSGQTNALICDGGLFTQYC